MKAKYHRIIKVLSSFSVILMVLMCTVAFPVLSASTGIYTLADLVSDTRVVDHDIIITYDPLGKGILPLIEGYKDDTLFRTEHGTSFSLSNQIVGTYQFQIHLFGTKAAWNMTDGLLDISDWKTSSAYTFECMIDVSAGAYGTLGNSRFSSALDIYYYGSDMKQISRYTSKVQNFSFSDDACQERFSFREQLSAPDGAKYIAVRLRLSVYANYDTSDQWGIDIELDHSLFESTLNTVIHQSETMDAIGDHLKDIEDQMASLDQSIQEGNHMIDNRFDQLIDGENEWNHQAQDESQRQESISAEVDDKLDSIDESLDLDNVLPDGSKQSADLEQYVETWFGTVAWSDCLTIFKPILENGNFTAILLMVVAFINVSVLLLGR